MNNTTHQHCSSSTNTTTTTTSKHDHHQIVHYFSPDHIPNQSKTIQQEATIDQQKSSREYTIFFPGDIQLRLGDFIKHLQVDYPFELSENDDDDGMMTNGSSTRVMEVYYEHVLDLLYKKYPDTSGLVIIQPSRLDLSTFIYEYDHFYAKGNANGMLFRILDDLFPQEKQGFGRNENIKVNLVAFSKGCVALNSILSETANCVNCLENDDVQYLNDADFVHWDATPNRIVPSCYKISLLEEATDGARNLNREEMERCVKFLTHNVNSIHFVDCHRFITNEKLLTNICKLLLDKKNRECSQQLKIHQTPLINENNPYRKHIKFESDLFIKNLKKICSQGKSSGHCPFLSYQFYYDELEGKVDSFMLHFKVVTDFEV